MSDRIRYVQSEESHSPYALRPEEVRWLSGCELSDTLVEAVYERFTEMYETDVGRDHREFAHLLANYQSGSREYRAGVDRALVAITGYRLLSLMKLASGIPEEQL